MQITVEEYEDVLYRYYIYGCAVRQRDRFGFIAERWYTDEEVEEEEANKWDPAFRGKRLVTFFRSGVPGKQWGGTQLQGWGTARVGAATKPKSQCIAVELEEDRVFVIGSGEDYFDMPLTDDLPGNPLRGGGRRVKMINGYAYVCGGVRSVGKKIGRGQWLAHSSAIPMPVELTDAGFSDIAGFSENDLYAVGGKGDVWRYDGKKWHHVPFPTNMPTLTVCCGGDGNVYISCYEGLTFMGRENRWKKIYDGGINLGFKDMVWHDGKVWCTNENGVWTITDGKLERVNGLPSEIFVCAGSMSVADGVLLMAGLGGAAFLENGKWTNLFLRGEMEKAVREKQAKK